MPGLLERPLRVLRSQRVFFRDVGSLLSANTLGGVLSFAQGIIVARILGPEGLGMAALVMSYPALIFRFFDASSAEATVRYLSEFHASEDRTRARSFCLLAWMVDFLIAAVALGICALTAGWAAEAIVHHAETWFLIIIFSSAFLPKSLAITSRSILATVGRFSLTGVLDFGISIVRFVLVVGAVTSGYGVPGVVSAHAAGHALQGLAFGIVGWKELVRRWGRPTITAPWTPLRGRLREIFGFILYTDLNSLLGIAVKELDLLVLGYFAGPTAGGLYRLAHSLQSVLNMVTSPLQAVSYPRLAHLWSEKDGSSFRRLVKRLSLGIGLPLGLISSILIPLAGFLVPLAGGEAYREAIPVAQILFLNGIMALTLFWLRPYFMATDRVRLWLILGFANGLFALIAYPLGAIVGGATGVAFARWGAGMVRYAPGAVIATRDQRSGRLF